MTYSFIIDHRLGIRLPKFNESWECYPADTQSNILAEWENIRGAIPDRIKDLEDQINLKQDQLNQEENFQKSCQLNTDISELASIINDLWLWYRTYHHISNKAHS